MAALAQSLAPLPGISVMWTPPELLCTQLETNFKDALLLVFKSKLLLPQRGSIPWLPSAPAFPFLCRTARFSLLWCAAALSASEPLTSPQQREVGTNVFLLSLSFPPWQGLWQSHRVHWQGFLTQKPCRRTPHYCCWPLLGPRGRGIWGSQAGSCVCNTEQTFKLKGARGTMLFSQQRQFSLFLLQIS